MGITLRNLEIIYAIGKIGDNPTSPLKICEELKKAGNKNDSYNPMNYSTFIGNPKRIGILEDLSNKKIIYYNKNKLEVYMSSTSTPNTYKLYKLLFHDANINPTTKTFQKNWGEICIETFIKKENSLHRNPELKNIASFLMMTEGFVRSRLKKLIQQKKIVKTIRKKYMIAIPLTHQTPIDLDAILDGLPTPMKTITVQDAMNKYHLENPSNTLPNLSIHQNKPIKSLNLMGSLVGKTDKHRQIIVNFMQWCFEKGYIDYIQGLDITLKNSMKQVSDLQPQKKEKTENKGANMQSNEFKNPNLKLDQKTAKNLQLILLVDQIEMKEVFLDIIEKGINKRATEIRYAIKQLRQK